MLRGIQLALWSQLQWMRTAPTHPNKSSNLYQRNGRAVMPLWWKRPRSHHCKDSKARVALASIAVSASFSLSWCAAIEELKETFLVPEAPERTRRVCRRVARSDSCGSPGENAEGAKQAAPTAEGCSAQTATADRCASSKETADPRFHRGGEAGRHRGAIRAVAEVAA